MQQTRGRFSSRLGFVLAAAGSAVGLGNIWGFPTQAASNGGAAFLLVYLALAFCLAYPVLMTELVIGRYARGNPITALTAVSSNALSRVLAPVIGGFGVVVASLILSFYCIVGGWMMSHFLAELFGLLGMTGVAVWLETFSLSRSLLFTALFMLLTIRIISQGVESGIERWSTRLMPLLLTMLVLLTLYVITMDGAMEGLRVYLIPDFSIALSPSLIIKALGSAFFSLSLGVGTMLIYGSYIDDSESLPKLGTQVTIIDISIAVLAGFLILPAMYVALHNGVEIFSENGSLISEDTLIFTVLPALFDKIGLAGGVVGTFFFMLMSIAALTSSISMLEVPVATAVEKSSLQRNVASYAVGGAILLVSITIIMNFEQLFGAVIAFTTRYSQPLLGMLICIYVAWVWNRGEVLQQLQKGSPDIETSTFWRIWPAYIKYVCPLVILIIFVQSF